LTFEFAYSNNYKSKKKLSSIVLPIPFFEMNITSKKVTTKLLIKRNSYLLKVIIIMRYQ